MSPVYGTLFGAVEHFNRLSCPQFAGRGVPSLRDGFLFLLFLQIAKFGTIPALEVARWRLAGAPVFCKANVRRHSFAIRSEPSLLALDDADKPVVLELVMPAGDVVLARSQLFGTVTRRHVDAVLQSRVVSDLQRHIE